MINLRFHIVSIVGIFLALAIGMLMGTTLLNRATVDVLNASQQRLDATNARLKEENALLKEASEAGQVATDAFGTAALDEVLPGLLGNDPILLVATRGIDEETVRAVEASALTGGASPLGIVWVDDRMALSDAEAVERAAAVLGVDGSGDRRSAVVEALAEALTPSPSSSGAALTALQSLAEAELVDWEPPSDGEPGAQRLPDERVDLVLLSGEGSALTGTDLMYPLAAALADRTTGVIVGEVRRPRSELEAATDTEAPIRGAFVDPLRSDDDLRDRIVTVDNVDEPFGRLATMLALAQVPVRTSGAYGAAASAESPFPPAEG